MSPISRCIAGSSVSAYPSHPVALIEVFYSTKAAIRPQQSIGQLGSLPTFAAAAHEINAKSEGEWRHCGTFLPFAAHASFVTSSGSNAQITDADLNTLLPTKS